MYSKKLNPTLNLDQQLGLKENLFDLLFVLLLTFMIALGSTYLLGRIFA